MFTGFNLPIASWRQSGGLRPDEYPSSTEMTLRSMSEGMDQKKKVNIFGDYNVTLL
jgi:hypothetical protein